MRYSAEGWLIAALATFALTGFVAKELDERSRAGGVATAQPIDAAPFDASEYEGAAWFAKARPFCNPVDVETWMRTQPPPASHDGVMYQAACYGLAGRLDRARPLLALLPTDLRAGAAEVIFEAARPAAAAGDALAALPLMELVVELSPRHPMGLHYVGVGRTGAGRR